MTHSYVPLLLSAAIAHRPPPARLFSISLYTELKKQGVELVVANLDDAKSLEAALHGAYGVFAVTNFWETQFVFYISRLMSY